MAILGDSGKFSPEMIDMLMKQDLRLLFISENDTKHIELREQLGSVNTTAEIEFTSCEREGCWEADIITLGPEENFSTALIQKIKEVATQKIVLEISEMNNTTERSDLKELLPYSKVIKIQIDHAKQEFMVTGKDENALLEIRSIFEQAGYNYKNNKDAGKNMV